MNVVWITAALLLCCSICSARRGEGKNVVSRSRHRGNRVLQPSTETCSKRDRGRAVLMGMKCRKSCKPEKGCRKRKKVCTCDGPCGYSCFNPNAYCKRSPPKVSGSTGYTVSRPIERRVLDHGEMARYGDVVQYKCKPGMIAVGPNVQCGTNKKWTKALVKCIYGLTSIDELESALASKKSPVKKALRKFSKSLLQGSNSDYPTVPKIKVTIPLEDLNEYLLLDKRWEGRAIQRMFVLELYLNEVERAPATQAGSDVKPVTLSKALFEARDWGYDGLEIKYIGTVAKKYINKVTQVMEAIPKMQGSEELKVVSKVKCLLTISDVYKNTLWGEGNTNANENGVAEMETLSDPTKYKEYGDCLYQIGEAFFYVRDYENAYKSFNEAATAYDQTTVTLFNESADEARALAYYKKGWALYKLEKFNESIVSYQKAIDIESSSTDALWGASYRDSLKTVLDIRITWSNTAVNPPT